VRVSKELVEFLKLHLVGRKGHSTVGGNITPEANNTFNLGSPDNRFNSIYASSVIADSLVGSIEGDADTVDGFHAASTPTAGYLLALDINSKFPTSIIYQGPGSGLNADYLDGYDSSEFAIKAIAQTITGAWQFGTIFSLGAGAQGELVAGLYADQLNKSVVAGDGLSGGGLLTQDRTLNLVIPGTLSAVSTNDPTTSHTHAITAYTDATIIGQEGHLLKSDIAGSIKLTDAELAGKLVTALIQSNTGQSLLIQPAELLNLAPDGNLVRLQTNRRIQSDNYISQSSGWGISYRGAADFRYLYTEELHARSFIADLEQALAGGQIISKSVAPLVLDFVVPAAGGQADLWVESFTSFPNARVFVDGDVVRIRTFNRGLHPDTSLTIGDVWGTVQLVSIHWDETPPEGTGDPLPNRQRYTFTRSTGSNAGALATDTVIPAGTLVLDYGVSGNGTIEANAIDGDMGANSPYSQITRWTTHPATGTQVMNRMGNLNGIFGIAGEFGLFAGEGVTDSDRYIRVSNETIEAHNLPIKLYDGSAVTIALMPAAEGALPSIALGNPIPTGWLTQTGFWAGKYQDNTYRYYIGEVSGGDLVRGAMWDGSKYQVRGSQIIGPGMGYYIQDAFFHLPFEGSQPHRTNFTVNVDSTLGQEGSISGGVIGRPGKFGKAGQFARATTNYVINPSFEVNVTDGWLFGQSGSGATITQDTSDPFIGSACAKITGSSGSSSRIYNATNSRLTVPNGSTVSVQARVKTNGDDFTASIRIYDVTSATMRGVAVVNTLVNQWELISTSWTNNTGANAVVAVYLTNGGLESGRIAWFDAVQMELSSFITPYCDGSLGSGHSWSGTVHNSQSNRALAYATYNGYALRVGEVGTVAAWIYIEQHTNSISNILRHSYTDPTSHFILRVGSDNAVAGYWGTASIGGSTVLPEREWVHLAMTKDSTGTVRVYVNGVEDGFGWGGDPLGTPSINLYVNYFSSQFFDGYIDDLFILNRVISQEELLQIVNGNTPLITTSSPNELLLSGSDNANIRANSSGIFGVDSDYNASFSLLTQPKSSWGGFSNLNAGDIVFGHNKSGMSAIKWNRNSGKFGFYGGGNSVVQVEINTDGSLLAGGGNVSLNQYGLNLVAADAPASQIKWDNWVYLSGYVFGTSPNQAGRFHMEIDQQGSGRGLFSVVSYGHNRSFSGLNLYGGTSSQSSEINLLSNGSTGSSILTIIGSGLTYSGNATVSGNVRADGVFNRGGTNGYIYVPLGSHWIPSGWNGVSKTVTSHLVDVSSASGAPADTSHIKAYSVRYLSKWSTASETYEFRVHRDSGDSDIAGLVRSLIANTWSDGACIVQANVNGDFYGRAVGAGTSATWVIITGYFI
jgi:hypothetical protein